MKASFILELFSINNPAEIMKFLFQQFSQRPSRSISLNFSDGWKCSRQIANSIIYFRVCDKPQWRNSSSNNEKSLLFSLSQKLASITLIADSLLHSSYNFFCQRLKAQKVQNAFRETRKKKAITSDFSIANWFKENLVKVFSPSFIQFWKVIQPILIKLLAFCSISPSNTIGVQV